MCNVNVRHMHKSQGQESIQILMHVHGFTIMPDHNRPHITMDYTSAGVVQGQNGDKHVSQRLRNFFFAFTFILKLLSSFSG